MSARGFAKQSEKFALEDLWDQGGGWLLHSGPCQETCTGISATTQRSGGRFPSLARRGMSARRGTVAQASRGKRTGFPYTTAGFTLPDLDGYGLRHQALTRPALAPSYPVSVRRLVRLFHTSSRPHLAVTPLCFPSLHLHQVGGGTFTLLVSARARHAPSVEPKARKNKTSAWRPKLRPQAASQMMFQLRPVPSSWIVQGRTLTEYEGDCAADRSLLGTWAHSADKSSRSRLCWLRLFPVLLTAHCITAHYSVWVEISRTCEWIPGWSNPMGQREPSPIIGISVVRTPVPWS